MDVPPPSQNSFISPHSRNSSSAPGFSVTVGLTAYYWLYMQQCEATNFVE